MQKKDEGYPLRQSPLFRLRTKRKLAKLLNLTLPQLASFKRADALYKESDIPKKNGGSRRIENPRRDLKITQARLARFLSRIAPPEYLFCPVKGRSYVSNAGRHIGHRVVRTLDVRKYFPSTTRERVYRFFRDTMECSPDVAALIADIGTYKGHLPTGSPLSPILAFYAHHELWEKVHDIVRSAGGTDSLYIDDLTISGDKVPTRIMWEVRKHIHRAGLRYHKEKTFVDRPAEITGVIVSGDRLLAPNRQRLKKHRAEIALSKATGDLEIATLKQQIRGLVGQLKQIASG